MMSRSSSHFFMRYSREDANLRSDEEVITVASHRQLDILHFCKL